MNIHSHFFIRDIGKKNLKTDYSLQQGGLKNEETGITIYIVQKVHKN